MPKLDKFKSEFPHTKKKEKKSSQQCFRGTAPTFARHQSFRFFPVGTQPLSALSSNCKRKAHFTNPVLIPAKPFATAPGRLKGCVNPRSHLHWFRWRTPGALVVYCDLMNNKNSTVIKLWSCILHAWRQLWVIYCTVRVFAVGRNV